MIKTEDAIATARSLLGTPYADLDCINLIKAVIRRAPGGVPWYTTAGTNALWVSANASAKYRDLTWRQEGMQGAMPGMMAFKRHGGDVHHVGLVTERGTVIHSSSARGQVVETALDGSWQLLAQHRYIEVSGATSGKEGNMDVLYKAVVDTIRDPLTLRDSPGTDGRKLGVLSRGETVDVLSEPCEGWMYVRSGDGRTGYASAAYLSRVEVVSAEDAMETEPETQEPEDAEPYTTIRREDGAVIRLAGRWRVMED